MARAVRVRNLARTVGRDEDEVLLWLMEHAPEEKAEHPASFVSAETAARVRAALGPPPAMAVPTVARCAACAQAGRPRGVAVTSVAPADCERCGGSDNRRAARDLVDALVARDLLRVLVVGGGQSAVNDLRDLVADDIALRVIDGQAHLDAAEAEAQLAWADVVAIWGGTPLDHKVSRLFTEPRGYRAKLVRLARRGVAALCQAIVDRLESQTPPPVLPS